MSLVGGWVRGADSGRGTVVIIVGDAVELTARVLFVLMGGREEQKDWMCEVGGELPLGTRLFSYSFLHSLQNASISLVTVSAVDVTCVSARLHPVKQMPRIFHLGHMRTPFSFGRFSQCLFLKTTL